jgi:hypothetical protein
MNVQHGDVHYSTSESMDNEAGCAALELWATRRGTRFHVARVVYWDAAGQFFFETIGESVPTEIAELLIREARDTIRVR